MQIEWHCIVSLLSTLILVPNASFCEAQVGNEKTVRVIYLVSKDRTVRTDFQQALDHAITELQQWYAQQLKGPTFRLHQPAIEIVHATKLANWFYSQTNGVNQDDWGFNNTLAEAGRLVGA